MMTHYKTILAIFITLLTLPWLSPGPAQAQWPPFRLVLDPSFDNGKITYNLTFINRAEWAMTDVIIKVPLPEGTRFLEAGASSLTDVNFDGSEVTFTTSVFHRPLRDIFFVVEVTDPAQATFTTRPWVSWKGEQPGDYLDREVSIDITKPSLIWDRPSGSSLELEARATVADNIVTYLIYTKNDNWQRMWDLKINVPLPAGATFLEAQAPHPFTSSFDGKEVSFFAIEMARDIWSGPLQIKLSTQKATAPFLVTHAWATWKNSSRAVGQRFPLQEDTRTGNLVIQPHAVEQVVADPIGDVPFSSYDLTAVAVEEEPTDLKIIFYTAGLIGPADAALEYLLYLDTDCNSDTGQYRNPIGAEYAVNYKHDKQRSTIRTFDNAKQSWTNFTDLKSVAGGKMIVIWVPYNMIENSTQFCWRGQSGLLTDAYESGPTSDRVINFELPELTRFEKRLPITSPVATKQAAPVVMETPAATPTPTPTATPASYREATLIRAGATWQYLKGFGEASYPPSAWQQLEYNTANWPAGPTPIGYGDNDDATLLDDMYDNYTSLFLRRSFEIPEATRAEVLILEIDYDDGFVAYLNGTEIVRRNLDRSATAFEYNAQALTSREAGNPETIDITAFANLLRPGKNVLAIQGYNHSPASSDFTIAPALRWEYTTGPPVEPAPPKPEITAQPAAPVASNPKPAIQFYGADDNAEESAALFVQSEIAGKLAVPIDNGRDLYDIKIFSLPDGQEIATITNARQPNFRADGQRLLVNREGGGVENVFEYNLITGTDARVSDAPRDTHPYYDPWGNRLVYGNAELTPGADGTRRPFIFVQCGLLPPHLETEHRCKDIPQLGILVPAGQMGEIWGTHPVWTADDKIVYKGCNSWAGFAVCGIYKVSSASTKGFSDGFIPLQLTNESTDTPTDTQNNLIAFMSLREGNWEIYSMDLNGNNQKNLSNSPDSIDGLPAISPNGDWIAFVSNRNNGWAVWATPASGGPAQKLLDLPGNPWGAGDRHWTNERISWGP